MFAYYWLCSSCWILPWAPRSPRIPLSPWSPGAPEIFLQSPFCPFGPGAETIGERLSRSHRLHAQTPKAHAQALSQEEIIRREKPLKDVLKALWRNATSPLTPQSLWPKSIQNEEGIPWMALKSHEVTRGAYRSPTWWQEACTTWLLKKSYSKR